MTPEEQQALQNQADKMAALMLDLIVFGGAAISEEDTENRDAATVVLSVAIKQARAYLRAIGYTTKKEAE